LSTAICSEKVYTTVDIAAGLRCTRFIVIGWVNSPKYSRVLKPWKEGDKYYINTINLKRFFKAFPLAIEGMIPDMTWFVQVMTWGDDYGDRSKKKNKEKEKEKEV
jgi:hypothetical protein